ncbi:efflux RND transporter periplasmic adaptor subunit [Flavobacteriaceae bacterium]|jgi:membrane fusion protein (multidrug efflux system)|nr:efflux RND transporter periplasmic adaptor subunit [Flavobacteriaceae bacterium]
MKSTIWTLLLTLGLVSVSCQSKSSASIDELIASNDEALLRAKRTELSAQRSLLDADIKRLDVVIASLDKSTSLPLVATYEVTPQEFNHFTSFQGTVKTMKNINVYPEIPGQLLEVMVVEGQKVEKDQVLARIDDGGLLAQLAQAKSQLLLAETVFNRQERLWSQNIGSEIQFLQAKTQFESAEKAVDALSLQAEKSVVRAPFDGTVDQIFKEPGTIVAPGMGSELFRVVNIDEVYVEVDVPETHITSISEGSKVRVNLSAIGEEIDARISRVSKVINPSNRSFSVEVPLENKSGFIRPNLMASVAINDYSNKSAIMIPQSVVSENAEGKQYCFALEKSAEGYVAKRLIIETGKTSEDFIEVLEGIENGALLITEGAKKVSDNQPVKWLN